MKNLVIILSGLILALPAFAQKYLQVDVRNQEMYNSVIKNPKLGYGYCQNNQIILLDLMIQDSKSNINKLALAFEEEKRLYAKKARLSLYTHKMYDLLLNQIMLVKIKDQLRSKGLYNLILVAEKKKGPSVLQLENLKINIETELMSTLGNSLQKSAWDKISESSVDYLKEEIYKEMLKTILKGTYKAIVTAEIRAQIGKFLAGQISKQIVNQAIKSTLLHVGKDLLIDIGRGAVIEVLLIPLQAYMLPGEGQLLETLEVAPELLINPEWINPKGSMVPAQYAWKTHCLMLLRKPVGVEHVLNELRRSKRKEFADELEMMERTHYETKPAPAIRSTIQVDPKRFYPASKNQIRSLIL